VRVMSIIRSSCERVISVREKVECVGRLVCVGNLRLASDV